MKDQVGAMLLADRLTTMARWQRQNMTEKTSYNNFTNGNLAEEAAATLRRMAALLDTPKETT